MAISVIISLIFAAMTILLFYSVIEPQRTNGTQKSTRPIILIFTAAFFVRLISAIIYPGHETDMACFDSWSDMLLNGLGSFYTSETFTDYPPGYMYILYPVGFLKNLFNLDKTAAYLLLKLPSIVFDLLSAVLIYKISKRCSDSMLPVIITSLYLFNPTVVLDSSIWGQTDSVYTFLVIASIYMLWIKRLIPAYFLFAAAIFVKPQALFYTPILIYAITEQVFLDNFSREKFLKNLISGLLAICSIFILSIPFGLNAVINQYKSTLASYSYASVNAYNLWSAFGLNWQELNPMISAIGYLSIVAVVVISAVIFFKGRSENKYFYTSAFLCFSTFMLSVKMHDRYAFASMALMLCSYAISKSKKELFLYAGISAVQLLNYVHVLFYYDAETYYSSGYEKTAIILSFITLVVFIFLLIYTKKQHIPTLTNVKAPEESKTLSEITKKDILAISIITIIYGAVALYNLGDFTAPQSYAEISPDTPITVDLKENSYISKIKFYPSSRELSEDRALTFSVSDESGTEVYSKTLTTGSVFSWEELPDINTGGRYLKLSATDSVYLNELGIYSGTTLLSPVNQTALTDEQNLVPQISSYKNSTYFDEIYHARTAYEFINNQQVYEWTHPPLGKIFISAGIKIFGMTPFGWRIVGTLFGILMLPFIYLFSKKMFGYSWLSVCTTLMFAFDFMHFSQSRIATIDVYVTFFIILMYLFMYKYYTMSFYDRPLSRTFIPLGVSGLSMGLAIACKWTGIYAGAGLAVIFFITLYKRFSENRTAFKKKAALTIAFCVGAFVIIPIVIYLLSYIPFMLSNGCGFDGIIQNQIDMFTYHGDTVVASTHPFSSPWYQWPVDWRPIWYYSGENGALSENISAFGNPLVWWIGIGAFIFCLYDCIRYKNKQALFLIIAYLAQLVPWMFVTRTTFIYHYFPSVPFVVLMIGYMISQMYLRNALYKKYAIIYTILCVLAFAEFYPVLSGYPINGDYVRDFLRWLPRWQLIG